MHAPTPPSPERRAFLRAAATAAAATAGAIGTDTAAFRAFAAAAQDKAMPNAAPAVTPETVLKTLRTGHPRLLVSDADVERTRKAAESDPIAKRYRDDLYKEGNGLLDDPTVEYKLVGPRLLDQSRKALRRVYTLAGLYRLDGDRKWVERAMTELRAAAAFPDWNPSHFLDVAEMTHAFAIGYDWLYPALSPDDRRLLREAIINKGLRRGEEAYKGEKPWKWWTTVDHNWNQVCNGGLTLGALAVADEEPKLAGFIVASALKSLPRAMASFGPDGGWNEGPGYWAYTVRYTVPLIAGLESALGTDFGLATAHGFDRTGAFRLYFVGPSRRPFNYADGGDGATGGTHDMYWLGRRFKRPVYFAEGGGGALGLFWHEPHTATPASANVPLDNVFRGIDVAFLRSAWDDPNALWVGFKGGDNAANHSHLDLGTFVFDALGERWASDLGGDNYNLPAYFGKARWTYYRLRTEGQNTLLLDGANQETKAKAPLLAFASRPDTGYAVADLTAGYKAAGATHVRRGVALVAGRRALLVQDEFATKEPVAYSWQMHTRAAVKADGRTATLTLNSKTLTARLLDAPAGATFAVESAAPPPLNNGVGPQQNPNTGVSRLVVRLPEKAAEARVAVLLSPGSGDASEAVTVRPLDAWVRDAPPLPKLGGAI
jgi:hypothetical protein